MRPPPPVVNTCRPPRCETPYRSLYEFESRSPSTHVTFTFELKQLEPRMRPFEKLIRMALQDGAKRTVRKLKMLIEKEMLDNG